MEKMTMGQLAHIGPTKKGVARVASGFPADLRSSHGRIALPGTSLSGRAYCFHSDSPTEDHPSTVGVISRSPTRGTRALKGEPHRQCRILAERQLLSRPKCLTIPKRRKSSEEGGARGLTLGPDRERSLRRPSE